MLPVLTGGMARHSSGSLAARLFGVGCGFFYAVAVARLLGPRGYGVVAVTISVAMIAATVALLGIDGLAVRETAVLCARNARDRLHAFIRWALRTVAAVSIAAALVTAAASLLSRTYAHALLLGSLAIPLLAILMLMKGIIQGRGNVIASQIPLDIVRWVVTLALLAVLILGGFGRTPAVIVLVVILALACALVVSLLIFGRSISAVPTAGAVEKLDRNWLAQSLPFLAIALFGILGTEIGTLLLGWLSGPKEAGLYQPIAKLAPLMMLANEAIESALAPRIVHAWEQQDRQLLQRRAGRSALASAIATAAIAGGILVTSGWILRAFGPEFITYRNLIVWVAVAQVVNAATGAAPLLLAMTSEMKSRIAAQAATLVVQAGLGLLLIPALGAEGAVLSLTAAILVWSLLHWWLALRATGIDTSLMGAFAPAKAAL